VTNPALVPEMRMRYNIGNLQASHMFGIASAGDGANSPSITNTTYDRLYFLPPANCVGKGLIVSFDITQFQSRRCTNREPDPRPRNNRNSLTSSLTLIRLRLSFGGQVFPVGDTPWRAPAGFPLAIRVTKAKVPSRKFLLLCATANLS